MKNQLLLFAIMIVSLNCYSQISFEKGYYINNSDQKVDCLIKNLDWKNNPTEFEYKLSENTEQKLLNIKSVKEFGIYKVSKYIRYTVNIDRSSKNISNLSTVKKPMFKEEQLFLKVLVEGKADLYLFEDGNLIRYFYNKDNSGSEQLVFKNYRTSEGKIGKNNKFKQQLWSDLKCQDNTVNDIENIKYNKNELVNFFVAYNKCNNSVPINFEEKQKKDLFNLTLRLGLNSSSLTIQNNVQNSRDTDFGNELGLRLGIEAEFLMPFNKNKWAFLIEPTYQYFKSEKRSATQNAEVDYKSIEFPVGFRHYFFLNNNSKIFINGSFIFDLTDNSKISFNSVPSLGIKTLNNLAFGLGYKYNNKFHAEFRYHTNRKVLNNYLFWDSDFNTISVIFGYTIF